MVKHTKAIRWQKPMNCLIVFDHFVGLGERDIDEEEKKIFHIWTHDYILNRYPVDTGRKLNVHKTFRRRPGHLLNVLCTCNLRPVSTG